MIVVAVYGVSKLVVVVGIRGCSTTNTH